VVGDLEARQAVKPPRPAAPGRLFGQLRHAKAAPMATSDTPVRPLRVVIVEDNQATADTLKELLELRGYEVRVAYDGPAGVLAACEWPPAVVLCDIGLPGLDGYGVAVALRQHPATASARLIAITAYGSDEARRRSREVGFERHFVKPVEPAELLGLLAASP
jgi:CheY-like chemotaxis protein